MGVGRAVRATAEAPVSLDRWRARARGGARRGCDSRREVQALQAPAALGERMRLIEQRHENRVAAAVALAFAALWWIAVVRSASLEFPDQYLQLVIGWVLVTAPWVIASRLSSDGTASIIFVPGAKPEGFFRKASSLSLVQAPSLAFRAAE